ncbi:MAG: excinuclease ABC subunit UvrA [Dehalococcoidia bacterium]|jgi:excinuclease ABC subunit A|nr:excinuclease ABC subunit A [Chloroflexota bacterium]MDP6055320.1 excinuclease ABC subunit UvrA [Dehalococcoidia bacterium]MDP7090428.1 excinuclease ABC subunit UvrA [Dehalococcoidia bacterium]MDP7262173.1 excinuclease ABC subunit UvrA [Dehalococcoidia bacterium]MDP7485641.1 excinuclease ABC subunit UvrA [Dehalococcoidia bacterium]|tara:strand:- start:3768 stop:6848 length:3081 start_codon:yes stop_codon:yes gene_type:complete
MHESNIVIRGAREHNLKNFDISIPRDTLTVITGVSGSGKSSLAFDTIFAEGQRRYVESLSAYARQFLGRMEKPDVDHIEGLSPSISIDQKGVSRNPRSTVGTVTEIYDYLRLLFSRAGRPHCHSCGRPVQRQTVQQIVDSILSWDEGTRLQVLAPLVTHMKGEHVQIFETARRDGFVRVRVDGETHDLSEKLKLAKAKWHDIEVVVDRIIVREDTDGGRLTESVEAALRLTGGNLIASKLGRNGAKDDDIVYSEHFACVHCDISIAELEPRNFSFNTPFGACPTCTGLGYKLEVDPELVIQNKSLSLNDGAITPWARSGTNSPWYHSTLESLSQHFGFSMDTPVREMDPEHLTVILYGTAGKKLEVSHQTQKGRVYSWNTAFDGVIPNMERRHVDTESDAVREDIARYMTQRPCATCGGARLKPEVLAVTVLGMNVMDVTGQSVENALRWVEACRTGVWPDEGEHSGKAVDPLSNREQSIAAQILKEVEARLGFLSRVGLDYLTLNRAAATLSGGEGQRIRLATQIGSGLMGVLYVCDEPTVGLHPADNDRLIGTLQNLRDVGNTVLIVEHDEAVMRAADHIVDLGPGAGQFGGHVVVEGPIGAVLENDESLTGAYLSGRKSIPIPKKRRNGNGNELAVIGARANNLKDVSVAIPLGTLTCVTGVSGSGKSTLVNEILAKKLSQHFYRSKDRPGDHDEVIGLEHVDKVINIDQSAIGRTPRSNPATYTGVFTNIRDIFASMPEAKARGYKPGRFSFNVKGGRCEACSGAGYVQIEMQFLPDVTVPCEICIGARYNREALEIKFKGKSIAEVLDMTVSEAAELFENIPSISNKMRTLTDVGLGYVHLGQPATTLSGGEAQRIKLASELSKRSTGKTIYILDEPTTGLSFDDAAKLMIVLHRLVDAGNSIILIEHHLDLIKNADWIVDLGPLAGERGGKLVAEGTPEYVASVKKSSTGQYLAGVDGVKPNAKAPGRVKARKFKTAVNGTAVNDIALPDRPPTSANGATKSRRNSRMYRRRRRGAATAG